MENIIYVMHILIQGIMLCATMYALVTGVRLALMQTPIITPNDSLNTVLAIVMNRILGAIYISGALIAFAIMIASIKP